MDALAAAIRQVPWLAPAALTLHLIGVAQLLGTIAVVDLRLLGLWRRVPVRRLAARLLPWTAGSFLLIVPAGLLMFVAHADLLIDSGLFAFKMGLILAAGVNAAVFHAGSYREAAGWDIGNMPPAPARIAGALSLVLWLTVAACGFALPED